MINNTLSMEYIEELVSIYSIPSFKNEFFEKFFPEIKSIDDYIVILPSKIKEHFGSCSYSWIYYDYNVETIIAVNIKAINKLNIRKEKI